MPIFDNLDNMNDKIGVIIPMYNVAGYIGACLDSLFEQPNAQDLVVYVVDDGSTDGSKRIVEDYAASNPRLHLLTQDHRGPGAARNLGLATSQEKFVSFLDADDLIPYGAYQALLAPLQLDDDVEFSTGLMESFPKKQHFHWQNAYDHGPRILTSILDAPELIHSGSACNKLFRRSSLDSYELLFPEGVHFEDARLVVPLLLQVKKFAIIPETVYLYRKRDQGGSIMDSLFTRVDNYWDYLELVEDVQRVSLNVSHEKRRLAEAFNVRGFQGFLLRYADVLPSHVQAEFLQRAYSAFVDVPAWLIRRNTHNPRHAHPFGLLRAMGKRNEFHDLSADTRLHLVPTKPQLGKLKMGEYDTLMRSSGFTVWIESATRRGKNLVIEGRISARGLPIAEKPAIDLELVLGKRRFPATWKKRADRTTAEGNYSTFQSAVPLNRWPSGEYFPRLAFNEDGVLIELRLLKTMGFWRNSRRFNNANHSFSFIANSKNQIGVQKYNYSKKFADKTEQFISSFKENWKTDRFFATALVVRSIYRRLAPREIWLLGERWDMAQDNSARLFEYLHGHKLHGVLPIYVVDKDSSAYKKMSKFGRVVRHGSISHKIAFILSSKYVSAFDTDTYLKPKTWDKARTIEHFIGKSDVKRIFLQHGVTFRGDGVRGLHRMASGYDMVLTSSEREREFFAHDLGYAHRAVNAGFPRFDSLERRPAEQRRKILFAPTWRSNLVVPSYAESGAVTDANAFMGSDYYKSIMQFLNSDDLLEFLEARDCELYFLPHYEVRDFFEEEVRGMSRIKIASTEQMTFQEWLRSADVFITDYSSTSFDVALMQIPIIYFGWDPIDPQTGQFYVASYFYYDRDGFGPVTYTADEVVQQLNIIGNNGYLMSEMYRDRVKEFFGDLELGKISAKVVDHILNMK